MEKQQNLKDQQKQSLNKPTFKRSCLTSKDIFLKDIKSLINNLLIDNPNYENNYYLNGSNIINTLKLIEDTKERAKYILHRIDRIEHLVK